MTDNALNYRTAVRLARQLALSVDAAIEVVDRAAVVSRIDDRDGLRRQPRGARRAPQVLNAPLLVPVDGPAGDHPGHRDSNHDGEDQDARIRPGDGTAVSVARTERMATIHRPSRMTAVSVHSHLDGRPVVERFVGLLASTAYRQSVLTIPSVGGESNSDAPL